MLNKEQIENNKNRFLSLVNAIQRDGKKDLLIRQLNESDFFYAPASLSNHCSYVGGLCEHSLNVFDALCKLYTTFVKDGKPMDRDEMESLVIVALFHDFSKMNYYTHEVKNKKVYSDQGSKQDSQGRYDWVQVDGYAVKPAEERFGIGTPAENSVYMIDTFIPLSKDEYCAILNHREYNQDGYIPAMWKKCPLALLLHQADCIASYMVESND